MAGEAGMAEQTGQISTGAKIAMAIGSLILATAYFTFLDYALMNIQGLDYFYMFRK
jgi:hypothetical protein